MFDFVRGKTILSIVAIIIAALLQYFGFDVPFDAIPNIETVMELVQWLFGALGFYGIGQTVTDREAFLYGDKNVSNKRW